MDFRDLLRTLSRHWVVALLVGSFVMMLGMAAAFLPQKTYSATATLVLDFADDTDANLSIQQVSFLLPALQEWAQSDSLRDATEASVPEELRQPRPGISAALDESVLRITATGVSPEAVEKWANAVSEELIVERSAAGGPIELILLDPAVEPLVPTAPNPRPILLASMVVAVIAAVFAALAADRIAQAFDTRHAVRERLGTTILGEIPEVHTIRSEVAGRRVVHRWGDTVESGHHGVRDHSHQRRVPPPRSSRTRDQCHLTRSSRRQDHRCGRVELRDGEGRPPRGRRRGRSPSPDACRATRHRERTRSR